MDVKNNHSIDNIPFKEFENKQMINLDNIKCGVCKDNNKSNSYQNEFFKCYECNLNLCPLCRTKHDKNHNIYNYDKLHFTCTKHNEPFTNFCNTCNKNICELDMDDIQIMKLYY